MAHSTTPTTRKLSSAQIIALEKFCQMGGHGFGEFAYLPRPTALALARMGFIRIGTRAVTMGDRISWGIGTRAGYDALKAASTLCPSDFYGDDPDCQPYGWSEWKEM